jgi:hypothetical protein
MDGGCGAKRRRSIPEEPHWNFDVANTVSLVTPAETGDSDGVVNMFDDVFLCHPIVTVLMIVL